MLCCRLLSLFTQTHTISRWRSQILTDIQEENVRSRYNLAPAYHNYRRNRHQKTKQATFEKANGHKLKQIFTRNAYHHILQINVFKFTRTTKVSRFGVKLVR